MPRSSIASYIGDLPPGPSNAYKVGAKFELFDGIIADITLFDIHKRSVLYAESIGDETIAKTADRVRSRGVEVDFAGVLTENVSIITSYGYTGAKVLENLDYTRKLLPNISCRAGSLFLTYNIHSMPGSNTLTFNGGGHGASRRSATNRIDYYLPDYFAADAFATYKVKLQHPATLQLNVKNLFDKAYYTSSIVTNSLGNQIGNPREV